MPNFDIRNYLKGPMLIETVEHTYTIDVYVDSKFVGVLADCEMDRWSWDGEYDLPANWDVCLIGRGFECIYSLVECGLVDMDTTIFRNYGPVPPRHQRSYDAF